ncbi:hypothetical protein F5Y04DRAFT_293356 [Hypomontagnella monticulosa]|nr:hypothetical protein F5Y04DRAFT_293356 [Hypomontagnella monticulosa]
MSSVPRDAVVGDVAQRESSPPSPLPNAVGEVAGNVSAEGSVTLQSEPAVEDATALQQEQDGALVPASTSLPPQPTVDTDSLHGPLTGENPITAVIPSAEGDSATLQEATPAPTTTLPYVVAQHATTVTTVTTVEASTFCQELPDIGQPSPLKRPRSPTPPPATAETIPANLPELQCEYVIESIIKGVTKELNNVLRDCGMLLGSKETYNMRFEPDDEQIRGEAARRFGAPLKDIATTVEYGMTQTWAQFARGIITRYGTDMHRDLFDDVERRARSVTEGVLARAANPSPTPPHFPEPEPETPRSRSRPFSIFRPRSRSPSPLRSHSPPANTLQPRPGVSSSPAGPSTPKRSNKRPSTGSRKRHSTPIRRQCPGNPRQIQPEPATPTKPPSSGKKGTRAAEPKRPVTTPRRPILNRNLLSSRLEREQCLAQTPTRPILFGPTNTLTTFTNPFPPRTNPPTTGTNPFALANPSASANPFATITNFSTPHPNPFANPNPFSSASEGANRGTVVGRLGPYPVMRPSSQERMRTESNDADADADEATGDDDVFSD